MVSPDIDRRISPETPTQFTNLEFLNHLYTATVDNWKRQRLAKIISEFSNGKIDYWDSFQSHPGRTAYFTAKIEKGTLLENERFTFGAALVECARTSYYESKPVVRLQLGAIPTSPSKAWDKSTDLEKLRLIVNQQFTHGSAEFYIDDIAGDEVRLDSWADGRMFGGPEIGKWSAGRLLTEVGIDSCVALVNRTIDRAFA